MKILMIWKTCEHMIEEIWTHVHTTQRKIAVGKYVMTNNITYLTIHVPQRVVTEGMQLAEWFSISLLIFS